MSRTNASFLFLDDDLQGPLAPENRLNIQIGAEFSYIKIVSFFAILFLGAAVQWLS